MNKKEERNKREKENLESGTFMSKCNRSLFLSPSCPPPLPGIYSLHRKNQGSQNWSHTHITGKKKPTDLAPFC